MPPWPPCCWLRESSWNRRYIPDEVSPPLPRADFHLQGYLCRSTTLSDQKACTSVEAAGDPCVDSGARPRCRGLPTLSVGVQGGNGEGVTPNIASHHPVPPRLESCLGSRESRVAGRVRETHTAPIKRHTIVRPPGDLPVQINQGRGGTISV